jgi:hypothetical protein
MLSMTFVRFAPKSGPSDYSRMVMQQQACPRRISDQRFVKMLLILINTNAPARELS